MFFVKRSCESNDHNYVKKAPKKWWKNDMILNVIFLKFSKIRKIKKSAKNKCYNLILHSEAFFIFSKGFYALKSFFIPSLFWPC